MIEIMERPNMFPKRLLNGIRRQKCMRDSKDTTVFPDGCFKPEKPSFSIEWDEDAQQWKMVGPVIAGSMGYDVVEVKS